MIEINEETIAEAARIHAQRDLILNSKGIAYALQCIELAEIITDNYFGSNDYCRDENNIEISFKEHTHIALVGKHSKEIQGLVTKIKELEK